MEKTLLLAFAAAAILAVPASTNAGEPFLSPKAKARADSLKRLPVTTPDMIDRSLKAGSPKGLAVAESRRRIPRSEAGADLVHAPRPTMSPKDPRYETAWRAKAVNEFQIAPLK